MGWDAYIVVNKQIIDECKWIEAMHIIGKFYGIDLLQNNIGQEFLKSRNELHDFEIVTEFGGAYTQNNSNIIKVFPNFDKHNFSPQAFKMIELTEQLNFFKKGTQEILWTWQRFFDIPGCAREMDIINVLSGEISLRQMLEDLLNAKMKIDEKYEACAINEIKQRLSFLENMNIGDKALCNMKKTINRCHIPILYEFTVGEHPQLPLFARHFQRCSSKVSCSTGGQAHDVLRLIFSVLTKFFPGQVSYFTDKDDCWPPWPSNMLQISPYVGGIRQQLFYKGVHHCFAGTSKKYINTRRILLAQQIEKQMQKN